MRKFESGATRDSDDGKLDYEGFLSPAVLKRFAQYMHKHRVQADGEVRASDNWQKGIPQHAYMKSMFRHFMEVWELYRMESEGDEIQEALCALLFNVQGMLFVDLEHQRSFSYTCASPGCGCQRGPYDSPI